MIYERYVSDIFRATFPRDYCRSFPENQFCEVLFALKTSGYLFLARSLMAFASHEYEEIFIFEDLLLAHSSANFQQFVSNRLTEVRAESIVLSRLIITVFVIVLFLYL